MTEPPSDREAADLSAGQITALQNLSRKKAGDEVNWISIADARALTDLGLAERSREGWAITDAGALALARLESPET